MSYRECKLCGAAIFFIETRNGKKHPVNAEKTQVWVHTPIVRDDVGGWLLVSGHKSHFETCPNYRKKPSGQLELSPDKKE